MGILNALGLMTRAEHDKLVLRIESDRDKFLDQVRDTCARAEKAEAELAKFRAKRDRDNAGRRERRARNATGAQKSGPARTKKVAG